VTLGGGRKEGEGEEVEEEEEEEVEEGEEGKRRSSLDGRDWLLGCVGDSQEG